MTEKEKMLAGELYDPTDEELVRLREEAHGWNTDYNATKETEEDLREAIMDRLVPNRGEDVYFQGPVAFDYGVFTSVGARTYANFNFTCLDCAPVTIGSDVFFGPNVSIYTAMHPLRWQERNLRRREDGSVYDLEYAKPVAIGDNCWIGGSVTICGGGTIGEGCVIGAGSVVTRDIPPNSLAAGVPCRVLRPITDEDRMEEQPT